MSTPTRSDAPHFPFQAPVHSRAHRWRRITLVVVLLLAAVGGLAWQFVIAPQLSYTRATDATRAAAVSEYCLPGRFQSPNHGAMTAGSDGNVWFTYYIHNSIARVTPQVVLSEFATDVPPPAAPAPGIVQGPDGNLWYVAAGKLVRMSPRGQVMEMITPPADMTTIGGITAGPDGGVWSPGSFRRSSYSPRGSCASRPDLIRAYPIPAVIGQLPPTFTGRVRVDR